MGDSEKKTALIEKLEELLPDLDEEGLAFLIRQATVLKHNAEVDALERDLAELEPTTEPKQPGDGGTAPKPRAVEIEQTGSDSFVIQVGRARVFFGRDELRALAKIVHAAEDRQTGAQRLHRWFNRERLDFLNDTGVSGSGDQILGRLYDLILQRYKPKA
ncbi:MAG: hypothetical protein ACOC47_01865 [Alkalispirochaetaceae bacterium]